MRYSQETNGFYPETIDYGDALPADIVIISDEFYYQLLHGQSQGKTITAGADGIPYLSDAPEITHDEHVQRAQTELAKRQRIATDSIAVLSDAVDLDMATEKEVADLKAWKIYRVLLSRVDVSTAPDIDWPIQPST